MVSVAFVQLIETSLWNGPTVTVVQHDRNNDGVVDQRLFSSVRSGRLIHIAHSERKAAVPRIQW